ncbi:hypothetical protein ACN23B_28880 (plasmid) [Anabaena sp. FACHB-709]|uniref:Uncharacterized protein n=2 Tax=Nostocaceae TaxID=1162 RepID=A0A1Z4KUX1_ANAVA|nr:MULTISPECIES: hypothetical protein [Nostocaceae]BAY72825.1 hypothetical protein NIES23_56530 [Trichormus variabilis NIES-23]MBD2175291.1 hypothetical protein [Anabaena cylindrica FACHB-318]MBD2267112.1 hypothetical protein [Anabaena sp. FACHB-709]MBD2276738.1 hypothetical protein [Nostoc sp. PCC 7120 = FACHB-418]MBD2287316.1 hypothetical protein [Anabaena cylindrica FACHB-170]
MKLRSRLQTIADNRSNPLFAKSESNADSSSRVVVGNSQQQKVQLMSDEEPLKNRGFGRICLTGICEVLRVNYEYFCAGY